MNKISVFFILNKVAFVDVKNILLQADSICVQKRWHHDEAFLDREPILKCFEIFAVKQL
jgi:hypothetical protein